MESEPEGNALVMTWAEKLYQYETQQVRARSLALLITWGVCFAYAILNITVWRRVGDEVWHECLSIGIVLTFSVPLLQIALASRKATHSAPCGEVPERCSTRSVCVTELESTGAVLYYASTDELTRPVRGHQSRFPKVLPIETIAFDGLDVNIEDAQQT